MKLEELESEPQPEVITDPCRLLPVRGTPFRDEYDNSYNQTRRMLPGLTPYREIARETINYPGGQVHACLVEDEETGLVVRQFIRSNLGVNGHLGAVRDDC